MLCHAHWLNVTRTKKRFTAEKSQTKILHNKIRSEKHFTKSKYVRRNVFCLFLSFKPYFCGYILTKVYHHYCRFPIRVDVFHFHISTFNMPIYHVKKLSNVSISYGLSKIRAAMVTSGVFLSYDGAITV